MIKKIFLLFIIILLLLSSTFLCEVQALSIGNIINSAENFVEGGKENADNAMNMAKLNRTSNIIYNTLLIIGICAAVIIATILGIQFITGSVEQKVKVKESLVPFLVGCIVIFSAFGIWKLVIELLR